MDAFATAVTAGNMILTYLDACASYSKEARSLYYRFKWDLRVLEEIITYFKERQSQITEIRTVSEDEKLLNETAEYLGSLISRVSASFAKIQASGLLRQAINQGLWVVRRRDLKELEQELNEWTNRFDVRLLGLPPEIKNIIPIRSTFTGEAASTTHMVESNSRMREFSSLAFKAKEQRISELLCNPPDQILRAIGDDPDFRSRIFRVGSQQLVLTSRHFLPNVAPGSKEFQRFMSDLGEFAAALHVLDQATDVSLLKVEYFFYEEYTGRFLFVHIPPYSVDEILTLDVMIEQTRYSYMLAEQKIWLPLNQRVRLAKRLAEAVFFLHTAGFVHKNITTSSIISLQRSNAPHYARFPLSIGDPYLVGFDIVRSESGASVLEKTYKSNLHQNPSIAKRNMQVFQHPDRLYEEEIRMKRYIKNYDVYSLGVVLLQIGLWEPINTVTVRLDDDCAGWPERLLNISLELGLIAGIRYQRIVAWCLGLASSRIIRNAEFVEEVLDPLDDLVKALT
ncbi:hypothetical protein K449DRAFT_395607 [Hypoxylon sp. EC38]|nr:hypothetical protein K449DRAFT_395607 [Hypoxylon sp. EC38]